MGKSPDKSINIENTGGGTFSLAVALLIIFTTGEPDLIDALIHFLMGVK